MLTVLFRHWVILYSMSEVLQSCGKWYVVFCNSVMCTLKAMFVSPFEHIPTLTSLKPFPSSITHYGGWISKLLAMQFILDNLFAFNIKAPEAEKSDPGILLYNTNLIIRKAPLPLIEWEDTFLCWLVNNINSTTLFQTYFCLLNCVLECASPQINTHHKAPIENSQLETSNFLFLSKSLFILQRKEHRVWSTVYMYILVLLE